MATVTPVSESSPSDLAVAFRSFSRRLAEARAALPDADARGRADAHATEVEHGIAAAAALVGADPSTGGAGVADRIAATRADAWEDATLQGLRRHASAIGAALRAIADLAG